MRLHQAQQIAEEIVAHLAPHCAKIEIAGSVRREKPEVKDIEIVCVPGSEFIEEKVGTMHLFATELNTPKKVMVRKRAFCDAVNQWPAIKGDPTGKYTQRVHPSGINIDIFMTVATSFGLILAMRTGSAEYSHKVLASRWSKLGFKSVEGVLYHGKRAFEIREEQDLFNLIKLPYVHPREREYFN